MKSRELKDIEQERYFATIQQEAEEFDEGTREMSPLAPFIISGGKNTERFYFIHVNALSDKYKFNIKPEYFGDESAYTEAFPGRIHEILTKNNDARIFCVFDMDAVLKQDQMEKHNEFIESLKHEIESGQVTICDSMPSFEFWLLLHFVDHEGLLKNYSQVSNILAPHIKPYFLDSTKGLKQLLKQEKHLKDSQWVKRLMDEGRIEQAVERAKVCLERAIRKEGEQSYSKVFHIFNTTT